MEEFINAIQIAIAILTIYGIIARLIPTVNDWTITGNLAKLAAMLSDLLNRYKNNNN